MYKSIRRGSPSVVHVWKKTKICEFGSEEYRIELEEEEIAERDGCGRDEETTGKES